MTEDRDPRPPFCFDKNCQCIMNPQGLTKENVEKGFSGSCFGKMEKPVDWLFNKVNHINNYYFCMYSPFKGWIRFALDHHDLLALKMGLLTLLKIADEHPEIQVEIDKIYKMREQEPK